MSYERAESFIEDTEADATTVESEFDNIADYFRGLFQAGHLTASAKPTIGTGYTDIAGTSETLTVARPSLLLAVATFDPTVTAGSTFTGTLTLDGVTHQEAVLVAPSGAVGRWAVTQSYVLPIGTGSHTFKLQCKRNGTVEIFSTANTGLTYLVIPEPPE
jgi:hypothetical protein